MLAEWLQCLDRSLSAAMCSGRHSCMKNGTRREEGKRDGITLTLNENKVEVRLAESCLFYLSKKSELAISGAC